MQNKEKNYFLLILIHAILGFVIYLAPILSKFYGVLIFFVCIYFIIKTKNRNNEVLYASAYIVGSEVFLRMTDGNPNHEFSKYSVMIFLSIGMIYSGFSKNAVPYWIYLLLLIPGVILATQTLNLTTVDIRKTIAFNISGPVCLGFASLYCYNRKIRIEEINNILLVMGLPIIACASYLTFFTPDLSVALTGTSSNVATSGNFGPNQVSTILGLGFFIFFSRLILVSRTKIIFFLNLAITFLMCYRGLITFSRGGMITGFAMLVILLFFIYINSKKAVQLKLIYLFIVSMLVMVVMLAYTEVRTDGLLSKRYQNKDALGRVKESKFSGREEVAQSEIEAFLSHPFFGIGVAKGTEYRLEATGEIIASHNEITRLIGEHGSVGILILLILFFTPVVLYLDNKQNIFLFCFLTFWLLTINHAAMRTAAPSFIYALSLLKVYFNEEELSLHRE
jgi:hypothetical protein